jgi:hypothetical protein
MIEDESAPYDMRIHGNSSALAWTKFFREHNPECNLDDNVMLGWFANAMMAMHDHIYQTTQPEQDNIQYLLDQVARLTAENAMLKEKWSEARPEQEQEPVAWKVIDGTHGGYMFSRIKPTEHTYKYNVVIPLYTGGGE